MENTTYLIRFLILNDENEVLKNFILTERKYDTREEAAEVAQTVCCVLMNHCGWNVFYRIVNPVAICTGGFHEMTADGSIVSDDELHEEEENEDEDEEEYEDEEENDSYNELTDEEIRAILRQAHNLIRKKYEDE